MDADDDCDYYYASYFICFSPLPTHISCPLIRFTIIFPFYSCPFTQTLTLFYTSLVRVATSPFTFAAVTEPPTQFRTPMPSPSVYPETDHDNNFYGLHSESSCWSVDTYLKWSRNNCETTHNTHGMLCHLSPGPLNYRKHDSLDK